MDIITQEMEKVIDASLRSFCRLFQNPNKNFNRAQFFDRVLPSHVENSLYLAGWPEDLIKLSGGYIKNQVEKLKEDMEWNIGKEDPQP